MNECELSFELRRKLNCFANKLFTTRAAKLSAHTFLGTYPHPLSRMERIRRSRRYVTDRHDSFLTVVFQDTQFVLGRLRDGQKHALDGHLFVFDIRTRDKPCGTLSMTVRYARSLSLSTGLSPFELQVKNTFIDGFAEALHGGGDTRAKVGQVIDELGIVGVIFSQFANKR